VEYHSQPIKKDIAMNTSILMIVTIILLLAGCSSNQPPAPEKYQGREETKKLEGASAVGYDGTAIRKNVDNTLNKSEEHNQNLDNENKTGNDAQKQ
jgi:PBP1b-binding outer membrane lipoprotein LpoB